MTDQDQALNQETDSPPDSTLNGDGSSPPADVGEPIEMGSMLSTTEFEAPEEESGASDEDKAAEEEARKAEEAKKAEEDKKGEEDRFDKHPRFVKMNTTIKTQAEQIDQLTREVQSLKQGKKTPPKAPAQGTAMQELMAKSADEIRDAVDEDPKKFFIDLLTHHEQDVISQVAANQQQREKDTQYKDWESAVGKTFDAYAEQHEDFYPMWDSGELKKFMDAHPGHNAISAHQALTAGKRQEAIEKQIAEAREEARKEAEAEAIKNTQLKRMAATMTAGGGTPPGSGPAEELQNPDKHGGVLNVLARRSKARQSGHAP